MYPLSLKNLKDIMYCTDMILYFEKPEKVEWKLTFREKRVPDIEITLI